MEMNGTNLGYEPRGEWDTPANRLAWCHETISNLREDVRLLDDALRRALEATSHDAKCAARPDYRRECNCWRKDAQDLLDN